MKHKHSELIKAWADGAEIQYYDEDPYNGIWRDGTWRDVAGRDLQWHPEVTYRIKPKPKPGLGTLMTYAIVEYETHCNIPDSIYIPIGLTHRFAGLILKEAISVWEQMYNGNEVAGYVKTGDYPKALLEYFGIEK